MKDKLLELAERCEQATGPDRELDAQIAPLAGLRIVKEGHPLGRCCYDEKGHGVPLPAFTASIDAAMTLVPEGCVFSVDTLDGHPEAVAGSNRKAIVQADYVSAATPALALCAAALRAMAVTGDEK